MKRPFFALILGGGAAKGLSHIGVLKALEEEGLIPDCIGGTSMGGLIGALFAMRLSWKFTYKKTKEAEKKKIFNKLGFDIFSQQEKGIFKKIHDSIKEKIIITASLLKESIVPYEEYEDAITNVMGNLSFKDLKIPLFITAVDLKSGEILALSEGSLTRALMATSAIPGYLPPVKFNEHFLVDGGVFFQTPVRFIKTQNPLLVVASHIESLPPAEEFKGSLDYFTRINSLLREKYGEEELKFADIVVAPRVQDLSWADFHRIDEFIERGYSALREVLPSLKRHLRIRKLRYFLIGW